MTVYYRTNYAICSSLYTPRMGAYRGHWGFSRCASGFLKIHWDPEQYMGREPIDTALNLSRRACAQPEDTCVDSYAWIKGSKSWKDGLQSVSWCGYD